MSLLVMGNDSSSTLHLLAFLTQQILLQKVSYNNKSSYTGTVMYPFLLTMILFVTSSDLMFNSAYTLH